MFITGRTHVLCLVVYPHMIDGQRTVTVSELQLDVVIAVQLLTILTHTYTLHRVPAATDWLSEDMIKSKHVTEWPWVGSWAPAGMGKGALAPWKCWNVFLLQMLSKTSVHEVFMHHFEKLSPTGELPLVPAGGLPSFRPPHCPTYFRPSDRLIAHPYENPAAAHVRGCWSDTKWKKKWLLRVKLCTTADKNSYFCWQLTGCWFIGREKLYMHARIHSWKLLTYQIPGETYLIPGDLRLRESRDVTLEFDGGSLKHISWFQCLGERWSFRYHYTQFTWWPSQCALCKLLCFTR